MARYGRFDDQEREHVISRPDAPTHGEAKNAWLTGTAAWNFVAITRLILGIRASHDGLQVDPCLPAGWEGFEADRTFRGARYRIGVHKPAGPTGRVTTLTVDGRKVTGTVIPPAPAGSTVTVEAAIG